MVPFTVRERDQQIWLKDAHTPPLDRGEMLIYYLNMDMVQLKKWSTAIRRAGVRLQVNWENLGHYEECIHEAYRLQKEVLSFLKDQPVYAGVPEERITGIAFELQAILAENEDLLRGLRDPAEKNEDYEGEDDWDPEGLKKKEEALIRELSQRLAEQQREERGAAEKDNEEQRKTQNKGISISLPEGYTPPCFEISEKVFSRSYQQHNRDQFQAFSDALWSNTNQFLTMLDDLIRVKEVYLPFLKEYQSGDKQKALKQLFNQKYSVESPFDLNPGGQITATYTLGEDGQIYRETEYSSLGSFLYTELMTCLQENKVPRCCANCGRFFMPRGGYDVEYCDNPAPGETDKTCKEVGARNTFARRVKDSPALQVFQRAYKTHHARIRSGHMTKESFAIWSARAMDLRDACLDGKITLEELEAELTKDLMYKKG